MNALDNIDAGKYQNRLTWPKSSDKDGRAAYRQHERDLVAQFRADLEEEFNLASYPKAQKVFDFAWEQSHSEGYRAVYHTYSELTELLP